MTTLVSIHREYQKIIISDELSEHEKRSRLEVLLTFFELAYDIPIFDPKWEILNKPVAALHRILLKEISPKTNSLL